MEKGKRVKCLKHNTHNSLRYIVCCLIMCIPVFLTACSRDGAVNEDKISNENNVSQITQKREWVYIPEVITVGDERADYGNMQLVNDTFCYVLQGEDANTGAKSICRYSLTDRELISVPIHWPEGGANWDVGVRFFDQDYNLYLTANVYSQDYSSMNRFLCKFDPEGRCLFSKDITEQAGREASLERMTIDRQGRLYIFDNDGEILLYVGDGSYHGSASYSPPESHSSVRIKGVCEGADGRYYVCISKENGEITGENAKEADGGNVRCTLLELDFESACLTEVVEDFPEINGFCAGKQYDFLLYDSKGVYGYDFATQKSNSVVVGEELLVWMDSDINGYCVTNLYSLEDGKLCATVEDWTNEDRAIVILERIKADQAPQRENLVLATVEGESNLTAMAVKFNRSSSQYHLTVKSYSSLTDLYNAVLTKEPLDLIDLSGVQVQRLASQGFLEDLSPYVEQSKEFGRADFVDGILDIYTFGDTLAAIPAAFTLQTVVGSRAQMENEAGLTLEELLTTADSHPGVQAFDGITKEEMMGYIMMFNEDTFIDWETGACYFDSESFKAVLRYINQIPDISESGEEVSLPAKIKNGEALFAIAEMNSLRAFQEFEGMFGEDAVCVGFPTADGRGGHILLTGDAYAIAAMSEHKEGAFKFIEGFLTQDKSESYYSGGNFFAASFPTLKKTLNEKVENAIETDSQYESSVFPEVIYSDGSTFQYHALTWDEVNVMLNLVPDAKPCFDAEGDEIIKIISEEALGYYSGQKGIDDVVKVIQNRVQLYVNENY